MVFLLSWTITLTPSPALMDMLSVLDHARLLNAHLRSTMENWIKRGYVTKQHRPNIIYVDAYDASVVDVVTMINAVSA
jgi:hypothetical protein